MQLKKSVKKLNDGEYLKIIATYIGLYEDVKTWANVTGNELINLEIKDNKVEATIRKAGKSENLNIRLLVN